MNDLEEDSQEPQPEDQLGQSNLRQLRLQQITRALNAAAVPNDEATVNALLDLTVQVSVMGGVDKREFRQAARDLWRIHSSRMQNLAVNPPEPTIEAPSQTPASSDQAQDTQG